MKTMLGQPREARDKKELLNEMLRESLTPRQETCGQAQIREVGWCCWKKFWGCPEIPGQREARARERGVPEAERPRSLFVGCW